MRVERKSPTVKAHVVGGELIAEEGVYDAHRTAGLSQGALTRQVLQKNTERACAMDECGCMCSCPAKKSAVISRLTMRRLSSSRTSRPLAQTARLRNMSHSWAIEPHPSGGLRQTSDWKRTIAPLGSRHSPECTQRRVANTTRTEHW